MSDEFRSGWEETVDSFLQDYPFDYEYEPKVWELGGEYYYPDFVIAGDMAVVEVKGEVDERSITKSQAYMDHGDNGPFVVIGGDEAEESMPADYFIHWYDDDPEADLFTLLRMLNRE